MSSERTMKPAATPVSEAAHTMITLMVKNARALESDWNAVAAEGGYANAKSARDRWGIIKKSLASKSLTEGAKKISYLTVKYATTMDIDWPAVAAEGGYANQKSAKDRWWKIRQTLQPGEARTENEGTITSVLTAPSRKRKIVGEVTPSSVLKKKKTTHGEGAAGSTTCGLTSIKQEEPEDGADDFQVDEKQATNAEIESEQVKNEAD